MIREEIKQLKTGERELRKFGLLVGCVFCVLGLWLRWRHKPAFPWLLGSGLLLAAAGLLVPRRLRWIYMAWMTLAIGLGVVVSQVVLTFCFFLLITPIGLVARLCGKDFLALKSDRAAASYWIARRRQPAPPTEYERQF